MWGWQQTGRQNLEFPTETYSWFIRRCFHEKLGRIFIKNEGEFGKNVEVMSILMYDSINQQCSVNRGGGKESVGNRNRPQDGSRTFQQNNGLLCTPISAYLSLFLQLQLLLIQVYTAGGYSLENKLSAYLRQRFWRGLCWQLSPLPPLISHNSFLPPSIFLSPHSHISPFCLLIL